MTSTSRDGDSSPRLKAGLLGRAQAVSSHCHRCVSPRQDVAGRIAVAVDDKPALDAGVGAVGERQSGIAMAAAGAVLAKR